LAKQKLNISRNLNILAPFGTIFPGTGDILPLWITPRTESATMLDAPLSLETLAHRPHLGPDAAPWPPLPRIATDAHVRAQLVCVIEGARDPGLLARLVGELARRSRVPDHLACGPVPDQPDTQRVVLSVPLSSAREAAHLAQRIATWPCVWRVRRLPDSGPARPATGAQCPPVRENP